MLAYTITCTQQNPGEPSRLGLVSLLLFRSWFFKYNFTRADGFCWVLLGSSWVLLDSAGFMLYSTNISVSILIAIIWTIVTEKHLAESTYFWTAALAIYNSLKVPTRIYSLTNLNLTNDLKLAFLYKNV